MDLLMVLGAVPFKLNEARLSCRVFQQSSMRSSLGATIGYSAVLRRSAERYMEGMARGFMDSDQGALPSFCSAQHRISINTAKQQHSTKSAQNIVSVRLMGIHSWTNVFASAWMCADAGLEFLEPGYFTITAHGYWIPLNSTDLKYQA
jgi:hypothetical protein